MDNTPPPSPSLPDIPGPVVVPTDPAMAAPTAATGPIDPSVLPDPTAVADLNNVAVAASQGADMSLWHLFISADVVVQFVILGLIAASFWS